MTVGLLAIMLDEAAYVDRWAARVKRFGASFDKLLVIDGSSVDDTVQLLHGHDIAVIRNQFANHFADQRNYGGERLGTDWIFELDADEIGSSPLLGGLRTIIADAEQSNLDVVGIPRLNFIDGALIAGPGHRGLDYQYRLHRKQCRWRGAVHEEVVGYRARHELLIEDGHYIVHDKSSARHAARNSYYNTIKP